LQHLADKCGIDPSREPMLIYPTLHYQNGGVIIDGNGQTDVPGLLCAGEITGGIHGRNRLMGNALLDILAFGRRAGRQAARLAQAARHKSALPPLRGGIEHVYRWQRQLALAGLDSSVQAPMLYPGQARLALHRPTGTRAGEMIMEKLNQVLLNPAVQVGPNLDAWLQAGGGLGLQAALKAPSTIIRQIADADLRGMGGAGFPAWRKWEATANAVGDNKYVVCNGNEDEPGTFKDRTLLSASPHQVVEGALIAALAVRAACVIFYQPASGPKPAAHAAGGQPMAGRPTGWSKCNKHWAIRWPSRWWPAPAAISAAKKPPWWPRWKRASPSRAKSRPSRQNKASTASPH
jgi:hypothetical protein